MPLSVTSTEIVTPPADRLAHLRSEKKRLKRGRITFVAR